MNTLSPYPPAVRTTCPYCGVGCGILAAVDRQGDATISGDPAHPANFGRLCSKGSALGETLSLDQRLLHPMFRQADGSLARTDWDTALAKVANGLRTIVDRDGPNAIAFYLSGQLLTEDYYVANKLMKGFLGSSNVDTNSRLCMASSVAGHRRAFGADVVPGIYRDLDEADLIVLVGSNAAWCHPVLYQRMIAAKNERGTRLVVIDPRRTAAGDAAVFFLPIASGMDTALFCGLLAYLADTRALNDGYIAEYTRGFADALARAREIAGDAAAAARASGLDLGEVARFFELFARTERVVTCYSQGVNQSAQGTDKVNAIVNVHLATGRIGRPGMGPFSPRPGEAQPDWWIVSEVAQRLGFESAFAYRKPADVFREHAALSAFENDGRRDFDLGGLAALADDDYDRLDAVMWPVKAGVEPGEARFFSAGAFFASDRRGRFIAPEHPAVRAATSGAFPLRLNTGRLRDQWHTMTRSGKSPRLGAHSPEPMVDIHPHDSSRTGITDGGFAKVTTPHGGAVFRVCVRSGQQRGSIFAPIHWSYSTAADACVGALAMAENDPFSGQPELKATPARVEPVEFAYRGFALTRDLIALPDGTWFARVAVAGGHGLLFATNELPARG